jgi:hypothetical protein
MNVFSNSRLMCMIDSDQRRRAIADAIVGDRHARVTLYSRFFCLTTAGIWWFVLLFWVLSGSLALAQKETPSGTIDDLNRPDAPAEVSINILSSEYSAGALVIEYEIPYDGIVDFKIMNQDGLKKFHHQYNAKKGTNKIRVKPMNASMGNYTYQMYYKGFKAEKSFTYS